MTIFKNILITLTAVAGLSSAVVALDDGHKPANKQVDWSFNGLTGMIDVKAARRGFQVYREVCSSCHSLKYFKFRNLADLHYPEDQIKAVAAEYDVPGDLDDFGDETIRKGLPQDAMPAPYANDNAARASNNGALPPDLSLMVKARPDGANYLYSLLTGYGDAPSGFTVNPNMHYNPYFSGQQIGMAEPLSEGRVEFDDGSPSSKEQMAQDIVMFLAFVAEPSLNDRHSMGANVMIFLLILTLLFYRSMKKIWAPVKRGENVIDKK